MAKTSYIDIPTELEEAYYSDLQPGDRFVRPNIRRKSPAISRRKRKELAGRTYLKKCSEYWQNMTDTEKQNWHDYDYHSQKHGWRRFVEAQSTRINLGIAGKAIPNQYWQDMVGKILIESPAEEIKLIQPHPSTYWKKVKVTGKDNMYKPVEINEGLSLPLQIGLSYKTDLSSTATDYFVKFYANIRHLYQGQNLDYKLAITLPLAEGWNRKTVTLNPTNFEDEPKGRIIAYNLYIHAYKVQGTILFDHLLSQHSGNNYARDPFCNQIDRTFTKEWYQIPKHWAVMTLPDGAQYGSVYPGS